jgi:hypothetical protein
MSYTDLLQSYQDRLSSMVENEESVGDYLLNKGQEKINSYLEQAGIPAQIGATIDQIGLIANNSAVKTLLEKSGLKGVADEQIEALNRTVGDLKGQIQAFGEKASAAIDRQVNAAREAARPIVQQSQETIDAARGMEEQAREAVETARQLPGQAQAAGEEALAQARAGVDDIVGQAQARVQEGVEQVRTGVEDVTTQAQAGVENIVQQARTGAEGVMQRLSPEYLQSLSDAELKAATTQAYARKTALREQFDTSELPNREQVFERLATEGRTERSAYLNEAERRGLYQREQPPTQAQQPEQQGVVEEPNVRPSEVNRGTPEFEAPNQQLPQQRPQIPEGDQPAAPQAPAEQPAAPQAPAGQPEAPRPQPPSEIEPEEEEGEELASSATKTEQAISTTAKVGTGIEETSFEMPEIGEIGEVVGALLQIGSLIASAFKPHETTPTIQTPISGFGFGSLNQFGVGGSSIV